MLNSARSPKVGSSGKKGCALPRRLRTPQASWLPLTVGLLVLLQGNLSRALPLLERAVSICQDCGLPELVPLQAEPLGAAYTLSGRFADAVPLLTQTLEQLTALERVDFQARCYLSLGEAHMQAGPLDDAHTLAERALTHARTYKEHGNETYALRLLGEIAAHREPPDATRPKPTTARPSPWPRNSACARSRPTATATWGHCMPQPASGSRPALSCWRPSRSTPSLTVARYMILRLFISMYYRWYPMYLGCLFCLFVYVEFFRICLQ